MPAISASAPGKIILFGEHAVVYGRPAIAVPVNQVKAKAFVTADPRGIPGMVRIIAPDIRLDSKLSELPEYHPLARAVTVVLAALGISRPPACTIKISSTIPIAAGLGSGAAVSIAILRSFSTFLGHPLTEEQVSALAYEVEKLHHGTPSGIDNTVITFNIPVYFVHKDREQQAQQIEPIRVKKPFTIVIGDTGVSSPTAVAVNDIRRAWQAETDHYESLFDSVGAIVDAARQVIENGQSENLGMLMDANHGILRKMGVSSPELDHLVKIAREAGALGAKLSGGGRGGNMIALAPPEKAPAITQALERAGAVQTIVTKVESNKG